ncbi:MAG: N-acetyl-gamma-glutamyl-phosphate reductase [Melioribacteraceae bacterium]|nr:N-acetyl-gamma-glutamyl-phosphate reductase [Melioribacteraceae bacterium]MCF8263527.1 N-acetyl-gamma-glutamyl-phosphate reductase [Melioribacteraceae bacterium]MCF8411889.1 N-acetyl-gamma-glutamyl-phosphate reductase [Melioribacteraceae bacterium]MCF8431538.1 N-acetyl-gamma-glutamyl-phosphate reductase [Melioribacteraceae bacterium]
MNETNKIKVGIIGGTGYTGKELLTLCSNHPKIDSISIFAQSTAGKSIYDIFPDLVGLMNDIVVKSADEIDYSLDIYFIALPHGISLKFVPELIKKGKKVVDLGGDFRLNSVDLYKKWYKFDHSESDLLSEKTYGLADTLDSSNYEKSLIANPGCYPTSVLLGLIPFIQTYSKKVLSISTVSYSGTSGAGKAPNASLLLSEMHGNAKAYNLNSHRHEPEILQVLVEKGLGGAPFSFSTHLLPLASGIYSTSVIHLKENLDESEVKSVYLNYYKNSPFVRLRETPPEIRWVLGTNFCDINLSTGEKRIIITSSIDNLIKGASGQAVQNMNKLYDWDERLGILPRRQTL